MANTRILFISHVLQILLLRFILSVDKCWKHLRSFSYSYPHDNAGLTCYRTAYLTKKQRKTSWSHIYSYWTTKIIGNQGYMTRGKRLCVGWADVGRGSTIWKLEVTLLVCFWNNFAFSVSATCDFWGSGVVSEKGKGSRSWHNRRVQRKDTGHTTKGFCQSLARGMTMKVVTIVQIFCTSHQFKF
jgi:hypothetical protein